MFISKYIIHSTPHLRYSRLTHYTINGLKLIIVVLNSTFCQPNIIFAKKGVCNPT